MYLMMYYYILILELVKHDRKNI